MELDFSPSETDVAGLIRSRRTINDFRPEAPPREAILQAIELARWAPNHKLTEPWRFHLLGPHTVNAVLELNGRIVTEEKGAEAARKKLAKWSQVPGWMAVSYQTSSDPLRDQENYAAVCCAVQNLTVFLWSQGIGVKWSTGEITRHIDLYELLRIDSGAERIVGLLWYGYPASVPDMHRRPVSEITIVHP